MKMKAPITQAEIVEGPLYEVEHPEDHEIGLYYNYFIEVVARGKVYTHNVSFTHHEKPARDKLFAAVEARGWVDLYHWDEGSVWDQYRTPQTWEEEKREALENEAWGN